MEKGVSNAASSKSVAAWGATRNRGLSPIIAFKVTRSAELLNGQVKGGTGSQVWIPRDAVKNYVEKINVEPLFVSFPKAIKR